MMDNENAPTLGLANAVGFLLLGMALISAARFLPDGSLVSAGSARKVWLAFMGLVSTAIGAGYLVRPVLAFGVRILRPAANWTPAGNRERAAARMGRTGVRSAG